MQGNVTMKTAAAFMPVFFQELRRDGQVDRAASVARGAVRDRPDWWMPVLFMRLKSGRIGYKPGFSAEAGGLAEMAGAGAQHPGRTLHPHRRPGPHRVAARLAARDRRPLGRDLPLPHEPRTAGRACPRWPSS